MISQKTHPDKNPVLFFKILETPGTYIYLLCILGLLKGRDPSPLYGWGSCPVKKKLYGPLLWMALNCLKATDPKSLEELQPILGTHKFPLYLRKPSVFILQCLLALGWKWVIEAIWLLVRAWQSENLIHKKKAIDLGSIIAAR